jgi:hypothetical protein
MPRCQTTALCRREPRFSGCDARAGRVANDAADMGGIDDLCHGAAPPQLRQFTVTLNTLTHRKLFRPEIQLAWV